MRNLTNRWPQSGHFFSKSGKFFPVLEKEQRKSPPPPRSSYTPVVMKASRILLLTKYTIMKLRTDVFAVSTIFL